MALARGLSQCITRDLTPNMLHYPVLFHLKRSFRLLACAGSVAVLGACTTPQTVTQPAPQNTQQTTPQSTTQPGLPPEPNLAAFSTVMTGMNQVPPLRASATTASGRLDAVLDKTTRLLRWKMSYRGLKSAPVAGHFHGPATVGTSAGVELAFKGVISSPMDGQATLTPQQMADLLAGRWYVNIHTLAFPAGEIRGQITLRE